jgi:hypothetical protein
MRSSLADAPLEVSTDGTAGPYIAVTTDQLAPVVQALQSQGIAFEVDDEAVMLNGRPALSVIDLGRNSNVGRVQEILDALVVAWRTGDSSPAPNTQNELIIKLPSSLTSELIRRLETAPPQGWTRRGEIEARMRKRRAARVGAFCFSKKFDPIAGEVAVWLHPRGAGEFYVSSIIPLNSRTALNVEQYNHVLDVFEKTLIEPVMQGIKGRVLSFPSQTEPALEDVLSLDSMRLLRHFSATANKGMPHPLDLRRWHVFVARTHLENIVLDTSLLSDWLQGEGWPQAQRLRLIDDYNLGRSLLTVYDEERADR